jgi:LysM repeat protein
MKIIIRTLTLFFICLWSIQLQAQVPQERIIRTYHVIEIKQGETLFSLSRSFNVPVDVIRKANPSLAQDSILRVGREIVIPVVIPEKIAPASSASPQQSPATPPPSRINNNPFDKPQHSPSPSNEDAKQGIREALDKINKPPAAGPAPSLSEKKPEIPADGFIYHTVGEKQTLFAISRLYNVPVEDIMTWNKLPDNNIRMGMQLLIKAVATTQKTVPEQPADSWSAEDMKKEAVSVPKNSLQESLHQNFLDAKAKGESPVTERVSIGWVASENPKMSGSYFCLHKSAPAGTIIKLTNLVNKKIAFVKVIGKLPETADNINVSMRVSSSVKTDLMLGGDKAYVESEFYP